MLVTGDIVPFHVEETAAGVGELCVDAVGGAR